MYFSNNIVIVGCRAVGKTAVARELAKQTGKKIFSIDREIEKQAGPINKIVEQSWKTFRYLEHQWLHNNFRENVILDTGGGIVENPGNILRLRQWGLVVYLEADLQTIASRLRETPQRPSLTGQSVMDELPQILARRRPLYKKTADFTISVENKTPEKIALEIRKRCCLPRIALVVAESTYQSLADTLAKASQLSDLVEIRLDYLKNIDHDKIIELLRENKAEIIATCRCFSEGGKKQYCEKERLKILQWALACEVDYLDIEWQSGLIEKMKQIAGETQIIGSYHNFFKIPNNIEEICQKIIDSGADILKVACLGKQEDNERMFSLTEKFRKRGHKIIALVMGKEGERSRIYGQKYGGFLTYAPYGKSTAPGQITLEKIVKRYQIEETNG